MNGKGLELDIFLTGMYTGLDDTIQDASLLIQTSRFNYLFI
jgi:hypothetical protein